MCLGDSKLYLPLFVVHLFRGANECRLGRFGLCLTSVVVAVYAIGPTKPATHNALLPQDEGLPFILDAECYESGENALSLSLFKNLPRIKGKNNIYYTGRDR